MKGDIQGVKVCRGAPILTHLVLAIDCFLFCKAKENEARALLDTLQIYEKVQGHAINLQKSKIFSARLQTIRWRINCRTFFKWQKVWVLENILVFLLFQTKKRRLCLTILPPSQNVSKSWSAKVNVFGLKFVLDTSTYVDPFLLTFMDGGSVWDRIWKEIKSWLCRHLSTDVLIKYVVQSIPTMHELFLIILHIRGINATNVKLLLVGIE